MITGTCILSVTVLISVSAYLAGSQRQTPSWWGTWRTGRAAWTTSPPALWELISWFTTATVVSVSVFNRLCACVSLCLSPCVKIITPQRKWKKKHRSHRSEENIASWCGTPSSGVELRSDLWSLDVTFPQQINGEHALGALLWKPHAALENLYPWPRRLSVAEHGRKC